MALHFCHAVSLCGGLRAAPIYSIRRYFTTGDLVLGAYCLAAVCPASGKPDQSLHNLLIKRGIWQEGVEEEVVVYAKGSNRA